MDCDTCAFFAYDEDDDEYYCTVDMDEDDYSHVLEQGRKSCPFWQNGDEYQVVKHQM